MKISLVVFLFIIAFSSRIFAQNISITDFEVPESSSHDLWLDFIYNWSETPGWKSSRKGFANVDYRNYYSSLPFSWRVDLKGNINSLDEQTSYEFDLDASIQKYLNNQSNWFVSGNFNTNFQRIDNFVYDRPDIFIGAAAGYGRHIYADAIAEAIRIDEFLIEEGIISDNLSKETLIEISKIISRRGEFRDKYGPTFFVEWIAQIEKIIKESGNLKDDRIGASGVMRIYEVLFREINLPREYGWEATLGAGKYIAYHDYAARSGNYPFEYNAYEEKPLITAGFRYSQPVNTDLQFNFRAFYADDLYHFKRFVTMIAAYYELTNRIDYSLGYELQAEKVWPSISTIFTNAKFELNHFISSSFIFYIENYLTINVSLNTSRRYMDLLSDRNFQWYKSVSVSLGYRIF